MEEQESKIEKFAYKIEPIINFFVSIIVVAIGTVIGGVIFLKMLFESGSLVPILEHIINYSNQNLVDTLIEKGAM